jgi:hypothetical protein
MVDFKQKLISDFPLLFGDKCREISIMNGWEPLVRILCDELEELINLQKDKENFYAVQVKEKFGTLRFYLSCSTDEMIECVSEAYKKSSETCEMCGLPGQTLYNCGLYHTSCSICSVLREKAREY